EISAFTKTAHQQSQHNLNYWQFGDYIGIGAGAHGKISYATHIERTTRTRSPKDYLAAMHNNPTQAITRQKIATKDLPAEFMMNALRLTDGVPSQSFTERTGISLAQIAKPLTLATQKKLLDKDPRFLRPTALGQRFLNDLIELFL
ncbi:MAG: oxygen-independent coproporphyrinogen III oxidase-like protein, partial [Neisseriaceae bacterium]|nr:oxygen-independent coproporphyrinogen III oxidase-like protein [Neisseriaceae bacterium]